jgi:hydrogenase maturation protease
MGLAAERPSISCGEAKGAQPSVAPGIAVIGVGNVLLMDEGLGVHAVRALESGWGCREEVAFIDGGTDPWAALAAARGCRSLLLLDAVGGGKQPGAFYRLELDEVEPAGAVMSLHGLSLFHLLHYERLLGNRFEQVYVLGMEPQSTEPGLELSGCCRDRMPAFVDMVRAELLGLRERLSVHRGGTHACH